MSRVLTVTINGNEEHFEGKGKTSVLRKLRARLEALPDDQLAGVSLTQGYKEERTLCTKQWMIDNYGSSENNADDFWEEGKPWGVDVKENGAGETRCFDTKQMAIDYFMLCASEKGEHWD